MNHRFTPIHTDCWRGFAGTCLMRGFAGQATPPACQPGSARLGVLRWAWLSKQA